MVGKATLVMDSVIMDGIVSSLLWQSKLCNGMIRFFKSRLLNLV